MFKKIGLVFSIMRRFAGIWAVGYAAGKILAALMTPLVLLLTQRLIDVITAGGDVLYPVLGLIAALLVAMAVSSSSGQMEELLKVGLKRRLDAGFAEHLIGKFGRMEYAGFEDRGVQNVLERMGDDPQDAVLRFYDDVTGFAAGFMGYLGTLILFSQVSWWFPASFGGLIILIIFLDYLAAKMMNDMFSGQTERERQMDYYSELLSNKHSLFELKTFAAVRYIQALWRKLNREVLKERLHTTIRSERYLALSLLAMFGWAVLLLVTVVQRFSQGMISLGLMVSLVGSMETLLSIEGDISYILSNIARHSLVI